MPDGNLLAISAVWSNVTPDRHRRIENIPEETSSGLGDFTELLAPLGAEQFFADYWQRRTFATALTQSARDCIATAIGMTDIVRLAPLAREGVQAWIANDHVAHSVIPVDASNAASFFDAGATLYFRNIGIPQITHILADFLGAPRHKIIASLFLTPGGGGAAPHFDKNENFTIQLTGEKRWTVAEEPVVAAPPDGFVHGHDTPPSLAGLLPANGVARATRTIRLMPGMMAYVPRGVTHCTAAKEASWSLNLSYVPGTWLDLVQTGLQRRLAESPRWRGTVTGVGSHASPAARHANILPELAAELRALLADPEELDRIARDFVDNSF